MGDLKAGPSPLRRLTNPEYANTVRDLLRLPALPTVSLPKDSAAFGFDNNALIQTPSSTLVEGYEDSATTFATQAVANLPGLRKCDPIRDGEDNCAKMFIADFGRRTFRRNLSPADKDRYFAFWQREKMAADPNTAYQALITAWLQSPNFLYRVELDSAGPVGATIKLTGFEIASRLSYGLWGTMPDDVLLAAAEAGELATVADVGARAETMLADPRSRGSLTHFFNQWLTLAPLADLGKDLKVYPAFKPEWPGLWRKETEMFLDSLLLGGSWESFFTADYTFANQQLAAIYGISGVTGTAFQKVKLDGVKRMGFLTQGSMVAVHSHENQTSPVDRGKFIREQLLCENMPQPPNNLVIQVPEIRAGVTTRQRFDEHTAVPLCASCHLIMDPPGLALENLDAVGVWRDTEQGIAIDATGKLIGSEDPMVDGNVNGPIELANRLAASDGIKSCAVKQWFRYVQGRAEDSVIDTCSLDVMRAQFKSANWDIKKMMVAITQTPAFLNRTIQ